MRRLVTSVAIAGLLAWAGVASAQVPRKLSFQGRLADPAGTPKTGLFSMEFQVWTAASGGTMCHSEVQSSVPVNGGLFSALIGAASGINAACTFTAQHFIAIKVGVETLAPRIPLVATPYVFTAAKLIAAGGTATYVPGNGSGNIPISNGTMNTNLNASMLDGKQLCDLARVAVYTCSGQAGLFTVCPGGTTWSFVAYLSKDGGTCGILPPLP